MELCPCGSGKSYVRCCKPLHKGAACAVTAEQLMRSRYCAYVKTEVDYILRTTMPKTRETLDANATRSWSTRAEWQKLEILSTTGGGPDDTEGTVEFIAHYNEKEQRRHHHEIGKFKKYRGKWYYDDGELPAPKQVVRETPKIGRNDPCPCGSGKKYKKCCGK